MNNKIIFDARWNGNHGIGRFSKEIQPKLNADINFSHGTPFSIIYTIQISLLAALKKKIIFSPGYLTGFLNVGYITIHDLNHLDMKENSTIIKRILYKTYIKYTTRRARKILTVSQFSRKRIIKWLRCSPEKVKVVGNGVSESFHASCLPKKHKKKYILCCSNRKLHKNEIFLINAFKQSSLHEKYDLLFTGNSTPYYLKIIEELNLTEQIQYIGAVTDHDLASYYTGAEFSVFPSLYEGFGLPIIESMACGTPVICSNITAMPEIGGNAAFYFDPKDSTSLINAMKKISEDEALKMDLIEKGFENIKRYSWKTVTQKIMEEIKS